MSHHFTEGKKRGGKRLKGKGGKGWRAKRIQSFSESAAER